MKLLFFIALMTVGYFAYGQPANFVIKGGLNASTIGEDAIDVEPNIGFHAGIKGVYEFNDQFSLQPEFLFSSQGARSENSSIRYRFEYINLPVLVNYTTGKVFFQLGPQFGYIINGKIIYPEINGKGDATAQINNFDFSLVLGTGLFLSAEWGIEGRYSFGLSNTADNILTENGHFPNRVFQLSMFYVFNK